MWMGRPYCVGIGCVNPPAFRHQIPPARSVSMRIKRPSSRTPRSLSPIMAWACLAMMLAYLLTPALHSLGFADHTHRVGDTHARELCGHHDGACDANPPGNEPPAPAPHDESKCQVCLTVCLTHGGASVPVEPALVVFDRRECAVVDMGRGVVAAGMGMHVRSSRGPPEA